MTEGERSKGALVIYHADCYDGFTAAWIASRALPGTELYPAKYGDPVPYARAAGRVVYILDFSYERANMIKLNEVAGRLVVLDHHKTAEAACEGLDFCTFDMDRSGCGMTWDWFYPDAPRPWFVDRVEDRDLWRFNCSDTASAHAFMSSIPMSIASWDQLSETPAQVIRRGGQYIRRSIKTQIDKEILHARIGTRGSAKVVMLNRTYPNCSEAGSALLLAHPSADYSCTYYQGADGRWRFSLRSRGEFDVSGVAKLHGGGGHQGAAGFELETLDAWLCGFGRITSAVER